MWENSIKKKKRLTTAIQLEKLSNSAVMPSQKKKKTHRIN